MRGRSGLLWGGVLALALAASTVTPVAAKAPSVYHGTWDHASNGACDGTDMSVTGKWNVTLRNDGTATVSIVAFTGRGQLHAAWGGNALAADWIQQPVDGAGFDLVALNVFGFTTLTFALDEQGELRYTIDPYCLDGSAAQMVGSVN